MEDQLPANEVERMNLLEVGVGYGELALTMRKMYPLINVYGVEHPCRSYLSNSEYVNTMAVSKVKIVGVDLRKGKIPFRDSSFNIVLFCEVIEHLPPTDVPAILSELVRVLKHKGVIILASPNLISLINRIVFIMGKTVFAPAINLDYAEDTFGHIRLYTTEEIRELAANCGLQYESGYYDNSMLFNDDTTRLSIGAIKILQLIASKACRSLSNSWTMVFSKT
jgi:2-polyprenyl-3-methyl-5-hydroxy-6-metoxy-1,4-benzoquinol methylase